MHTIRIYDVSVSDCSTFRFKVAIGLTVLPKLFYDWNIFYLVIIVIIDRILILITSK